MSDADVHFAVRPRDRMIESRLVDAGVPDLLARLLAARGATQSPPTHAAALLPPHGLLGIDRAAARIADAIERHERIVIVADYDCDGATACAVGLIGLRALGAQTDYLVPDRFKTGYGLTPAIVDLAAATRPALIVTVDNGIASHAGIDHANALGIEVIVTDHHLPAATLPAATAIVNPNQPGCSFPSKSIAGVGVMFYVVAAVRAVLRDRARYADSAPPRLDALLDLVALGTVADLVRLDANNRLFVTLGLERIRNARTRPGIEALARVAGREPSRLTTADLGFALAPRLNAAGRLADMSLGIECLIADDPSRAFELAMALDAMNAQRRELQAEMTEWASLAIDTAAGIDADAPALVLRDDRFHAGVTGLVASKLKELHHRPTIVFAPQDGTRLVGSGRSIAGFHLRDAIDLVVKRAPHVVERFGGHAMAAGLTIEARHYDDFVQGFRHVALEWLGPRRARRVVTVDGSLETAYLNVDHVRWLDTQVWGQGFEPPLFFDAWHVRSQRVVKDKHLKAVVERDGKRFDAIAFHRTTPLPDRAELAYRLAINEFGGAVSVQLVVEHVR